MSSRWTNWLLLAALPLCADAAAVKQSSKLLQPVNILTPSELASEFFADTDMPCTYMCDYRPVSTVIPRELTSAEKEYLQQQPIYTSVTSVQSSCPAISALNTDYFDLGSLTLQAGTHLLMYGHSYLWESAHVIRAAHKYLGQLSRQESLCEDDSTCTGGHACICSGGAQQLAEPYCGGTSNFNCDCAKGLRYYFSNGATLTTIFNWDHYQQESKAENLVSFLNKGVNGAVYTHALIMEPHSDVFFTNPSLLVMAKDKKYGCGWSEKLWSTFNTALQGTKKFHVPAWGFSQTNMAIPSSSPPVLYPNTLQSNCTAENQWTNGGTHASNFASGGIQGHHCIAARDTTGYYLGVVPKMAAEFVSALYK